MRYGDSNTYGFVPETGLRYPKDIRYTGRLQLLLGDDYTVIEEGCNGRTTIHDDPVDGWKNGLDYLKPCLSSHKPVDIVILMLGSNDLKVSFHLTAEEIAEGAIERSKQFLKFYKKVADSEGCIFLDAAKYIYPSETDSLHLTPEGHKILSEELCKLVKAV